MTELIFSDSMTVKLIHSDASDDHVIQSAQVSSKGENSPDTIPERLIWALMKDRHGSPFEHNSFTFFGEVPIFVMREWIRHRVGSFNEMSGRYSKLPPKFYIPPANRGLRNIGTKMRPEFVHDSRIYYDVSEELRSNSLNSWRGYEALLEKGVASEVARFSLPLNIYTQFYWTVNARSLMNFLSLRGSQEGAAVVSHPQREIQMAAEDVEAFFAEKMPYTHRAFVKNGRVAP